MTLCSESENFLVDQVDVSADAAQVARRPFDAGLEHTVIARIDVDHGFDVAIGVGSSMAPHGVSKRPGDPVVMHVKTVATWEMTPASDNLDSRLT